MVMGNLFGRPVVWTMATVCFLVLLAAQGDDGIVGKAPRLAAAPVSAPAESAVAAPVPVVMYSLIPDSARPRQAAEQDRIRESIESANRGILPGGSSFGGTAAGGAEADYPLVNIPVTVRSPSRSSDSARSDSLSLDLGWGWLADGVADAQAAARTRQEGRERSQRSFLNAFDLTPRNPFDALVEADALSLFTEASMPMLDEGSSRATDASPGVSGAGESGWFFQDDD